MRAEIYSVVTVAALAIGAPSLDANAAPKVQTGPNAEVTHDGLTRVDRSVADAAWVKADLDLHPYKKLILVGGEIKYRAVDSNGRYYRPGASNNPTDFAISDENRKMLQEIVGEQFREELAKSKRYELTTTPGYDTLILVGTLIDVVSKVPPEAPGRYDVYLASVGEATLVLELRDSITNEVLARAADRRAAEQEGFQTPVNQVTAWSEVRQLARSWAITLRKRLDTVTSVGEM